MKLPHITHSVLLCALVVAAFWFLPSCDRFHGSLFPASFRSSIEVEHAKTLSPEDLGMKKLLFKALPGKGQVAVFRMEQYIDGRLDCRCDQITNRRDQTTVESFLVINWSIFKEERRNDYRFKGGEFTIKGADFKFDLHNVIEKNSTYPTGSMTRPPVAEFNFQDVSKEHPTETKFLFSVIIESYEDAKREHPDLGGEVPNQSWVGMFPEWFPKK